MSSLYLNKGTDLLWGVFAEHLTPKYPGSLVDTAFPG